MQVETHCDQDSSDDPDFESLLRRVKAGSSDAAWELIDRYGYHVQRVVRRLLNRRLRQQYDSVDFVQAVWASFFHDPAQIHSFESPDGVIGYLARMARNKVVEENRRQLGTQKRDLHRVLSLEDNRIQGDELVDRGPRPSQVAAAKDRWNRLIANQPPRYHEIIRLRFMGLSFVEIAQQLELDERSVRKIVERLLQLHQRTSVEQRATG